MESTLDAGGLGEATGAAAASWLDAFLGLIRRARQTKEERALAGLVEIGAETIGAPLLAAEDLTDLSLRIDAAVSGAAFASWWRLFAAQLGQSQLARVASVELRDEWPTEALEAYGLGCRDLLNRGLCLMHEQQRALRRLFEKVPPAEVVAASQQLDNPGELLRNPDMHPNTSTVLYSMFASPVTLLGICEAIRRERPPEPWLARALASAWVEHEWVYLRVLAAVPMFGVPESVVPVDQRIDPDVWQHELSAARAEIDARGACASVVLHALDGQLFRVENET